MTKSSPSPSSFITLSTSTAVLKQYPYWLPKIWQCYWAVSDCSTYTVNHRNVPVCFWLQLSDLAFLGRFWLMHVLGTGFLSVCPSHAGIVSKRLYIVMLSSPHDSPFILVLCVSRSSRNSDGVNPCGGAINRGGVWKCRNFRPITWYISEMVEDRWVYAARRFTRIEYSFHPCNSSI